MGKLGHLTHVNHRLIYMVETDGDVLFLFVGPVPGSCLLCPNLRHVRRLPGWLGYLCLLHGIKVSVPALCCGKPELWNTLYGCMHRSFVMGILWGEKWRGGGGSRSVFFGGGEKQGVGAGAGNEKELYGGGGGGEKRRRKSEGVEDKERTGGAERREEGGRGVQEGGEKEMREGKF